MGTTRRVRSGAMLLAAIAVFTPPVDRAAFARGGGSGRGGWIIAGPWDELPDGAASGLRVDPETRGLTLAASETDFVFLAEPDPAKGPPANAARELEASDGLVYIGYGDLVGNSGPVDIVAYDPLSGSLLREAQELPEEQLGGFVRTNQGQLLAAGFDASESHAFGNFFVRDVRGWNKRRTVPGALHVFEVATTAERWRVRFDGGTTPGFPYVLSSVDRGASFSFERIDEGSATNVINLDFEALGDSDFYVVTFVVDPDHPEDRQRVYHSDGQEWERVPVEVPEGRFLPQQLLAFGGGVLVRGGAFAAGGNFVDSVHVLKDGTQHGEVAFLHERFVPFGLCTVTSGQLYCIESPPGDDPLRPHLLHRTSDLERWETLGEIELLPGAVPTALALAHGRLFVGARGYGGARDPTAGYDSSFAQVQALEAASLGWEADVPDEATLRLQVRTGRTAAELLARPFVGPDGTSDSFFAAPGQALAAGHAGDTLVQIRVLKTPNEAGEPPRVRWVAIEDLASTRILAMEEGQGLYGGRVRPSGGKLVSAVQRLDERLAGGRLFVDADTPAGSEIRVQVRGAPSAAELASRPFVGPDGTSNSAHGVGSSSLWEGHDGGRFVQFRIELLPGGAAFAPVLRQVAIEAQPGLLSRLSIETGAGLRSGWAAGAAQRVRVTALDALNRRLPIEGQIRLTVEGDAGPLSPQSYVRLHQGGGQTRVRVERAGAMKLCARLGDIASCSEQQVLPGKCAGFEIEAELSSPGAWLSPRGTVDVPFQLHIRALDRFGNHEPDYVGTVECRSLQAPFGIPEEPPLLSASFQPADAGSLATSVALPSAGEFDFVCRDVLDPTKAGSVTILISDRGTSE